jgi:hypothetical protein
MKGAVPSFLLAPHCDARASKRQAHPKTSYPAWAPRRCAAWRTLSIRPIHFFNGGFLYIFCHIEFPVMNFAALLTRPNVFRRFFYDMPALMACPGKLRTTRYFYKRSTRLETLLIKP